MIIEIRMGSEATTILVFALVGNRAEQMLIVDLQPFNNPMSHQTSM